MAVAATMVTTGLTGCSSDSGKTVLTWYVNPDNGGQDELAAKCSKAAKGRYEIRTAKLPRESTGQREQLVRRLAANDSSIDLLSLDVPYVAEFANAGFIRQFTAEERAELTEGMLNAPLESAQWEDQLFAVPFNANTQLLWVRKSVAKKAGLDLSQQLTWDQVIDAAVRTKTTVQVQGKRYEGYTVLINSLIASAGGQILKNPDAGKEAEPGVGSAAGQKAARVLKKLATSSAAASDLSNSDEGTTQAGFLADNGGFATNWPFVYTAATGELGEAKKSGDAAAIAAKQKVVDDFAWSRWPTLDAGSKSQPPLGGIDLGIGAFTLHEKEAVDAVRCITSADSQELYMNKEGLLPTLEEVYDRPSIKKNFPMADLLKESVDKAAPRPITPYYADVTSVIQQTWHPETAIDPEHTPKTAADVIVAVLHDEKLI